MMRNIFKTLFFFILITSASCTKENNQLGNGKVKVNSIGYKFNDVITKSNKNIQERVIASSALELDENYILIGELVETNEEIINTKQYTYEDVTDVQVLTFYKQDAKTENRLQDLDMTNKTFELPPEGECDVVFLGNVGGTSPKINIDDSKDEATVTSVVETGTNLCYFTKSYGNSIPATEDLSKMTPLFAQIGEVVVPELTIDNWSIEAINDLKITAGCQETSGVVTIGRNSVSYTKTKVDSPVSIGSFKGKTTTETNLNVIPNGKNFVIKADVKLTNKTNSVNLSFDFNQPIVSGKRYKLNFSVRRNGISIKFYTNTQQLGVYSETFNKNQQITIKDMNQGGSIATIGDDGTVYFKYGETITLPPNPQKDSDTYYNPNDFMTFYKWSKQQDCRDGLLGSTIQLTFNNFPNLANTDEIELYAFYAPNFYYWGSQETVYKGGDEITSMPSTYIADGVFLETPRAYDYKKYFGIGTVFFYDDGYTEDKQQGYWVKKWGRGSSGNTISSTYDDDGSKIIEPTAKISNGNFQTGYNKDDFFFLPILGFYAPSKDNGSMAPNCATSASGAYDGAFWSSDAIKNNSTFAEVEYMSQGISLLKDGDGVKLYGKISYYDYSSYSTITITSGFAPITNYNTIIYKNALLVTWPDDTYSGN